MHNEPGRRCVHESTTEEESGAGRAPMRPRTTGWRVALWQQGGSHSRGVRKFGIASELAAPDGQMVSYTRVVAGRRTDNVLLIY